MDAGSEGDINRIMNHSPPEGSKRPKRQMKTPFQLEMLEKTYASMLSFFPPVMWMLFCSVMMQFVCFSLFVVFLVLKMSSFFLGKQVLFWLC